MILCTVSTTALVDDLAWCSGFSFDDKHRGIIWRPSRSVECLILSQCPEMTGKCCALHIYDYRVLAK